MTTTTVSDEGLKNSLAVSAFLHVLLLLFLYFGLPRLIPPLPSHHDPVPFQIVEIAELTNTRIKEPEPQIKPPEPTPAPPPKPEPPKPQVQALPQPKPPPEQVEALKPAEKPKPPEPKKADTQDFAKLLKNLETNKKQDTPKAETKADSKEKPVEAKSQAPTLSSRLTISEEDALRRQIEGCWNAPIGARDAQNLIVDLAIEVNPDRTVASAEIVDKSRYASDSFFRAAADSARRAVLNPNCSPLLLPADKYDQWKHIDFTFDPRDML